MDVILFYFHFSFTIPKPHAFDSVNGPGKPHQCPCIEKALEAPVKKCSESKYLLEIVPECRSVGNGAFNFERVNLVFMRNGLKLKMCLVLNIKKIELWTNKQSL